VEAEREGLSILTPHPGGNLDTESIMPPETLIVKSVIFAPSGN
jgi:hypothetical protein